MLLRQGAQAGSSRPAGSTSLVFIPVLCKKKKTVSPALTSLCVLNLPASVNQGLCLDAEVALATGQLLPAPNSHQSSSAASHFSESRGETPCSFNDEDDEDEEEDPSSPE